MNLFAPPRSAAAPVGSRSRVR